MHDNGIEGNLGMLKGNIEEQESQLTNDDMDQSEGEWEQLSENIQSTSGRAKDSVEGEIAVYRTTQMSAKAEADDRMMELMDYERPGPSAR